MFGELHKPVQSLHDQLRVKGRILAVAESCTGGMLGGTITSVPGSSDVFAGGVIAYSNKVKKSLLDVPEDVLEKNGAVSEPCARYMARGLLDSMEASLGLSITGIAGPDGGSVTKPVGTVYLGCSTPRSVLVSRHQFDGNRHQVRWLSVKSAIDFALSRLNT